MGEAMAKFTREEIVEKVKKLLKLSGSSNTNEAASAAAKAQELMDRFEIEIAALQSESPKDTIIKENIEEHNDFEQGGRIERWRGFILNALCKTNHCSTYILREKYEKTSFRVIGRKTDIQTVRYMYNSLIQVVEDLSFHYRGSGRKFIASYKAGAASAIANKIIISKEQTKAMVYQEASQQGTQALMRVDNAMAILKQKDFEMEEYLRNLNLNLKRTQARISNSSGFSTGYQDGQGVNIGNNSRQLHAGKNQLT